MSFISSKITINMLIIYVFIFVFVVSLAELTCVNNNDNNKSVINTQHHDMRRMIRYVRISTTAPPLIIGQVEVFVGSTNVAPINGRPSQSSIMHDDMDRHGPYLALNGDLSAAELGFGSGDASRTKLRDRSPWWEVDLGQEMPVDQINLWLQDRGRFPNPFSAWHVNSDIKILVELFCAKRSLKWRKRVHYWEDVISIPVE